MHASHFLWELFSLVQLPVWPEKLFREGRNLRADLPASDNYMPCKGFQYWKYEFPIPASEGDMISLQTE